MAQSLWEKVWQFLKRLNIHLPFDPAILLLIIYPREKKIYAHKKGYIKIFVVTLLTLAPKWKYLRCPAIGKWIKKL